MIVSVAIVVLPVERSPMMSSRCPRPMGIIASIGMMPVCSAWLTGWRGMMPGAIFSIGARSFAGTGPLPSSGLPSVSITRPSSSLPTGTLSRRPVVLQVMPSLSEDVSPMTTTPTMSCSRLNAMPSSPFSNASISFIIVFESPSTFATPSASSTTVPTFAFSGFASSDAIADRMSSSI